MIRLGIIGTGRIAKRFVYDAWQGLDVEIVGVYNPHMESAEKFCAENHVKALFFFRSIINFSTIRDIVTDSSSVNL